MLSAVLPEYSFDDLIKAIEDNNIKLLEKILNRNKNLINQKDNVRV